MNRRNVDTTLKEDFTIRGLGQLPIFLAVAEKRSFSAAARELAISPSAVSQAVGRLEQELGTVLFYRTTRSVSLTDAGAQLAEEAGPALGLARAALGAIARKRQEPSGVLKLNVPRLACRLALPPVLAAYARKHPEMRVEIAVEDRNVDIVTAGFDAGIRLREAVHKDMITVRLSPPIRFVVVASKRYLAQRGEPKAPRDLIEHACLPWKSPTTGLSYRWEFEQRGRELEIAVNGPILSNDADVLIACAERHLGLAYVAEHEVHRELASGRLQTVLEAFCPQVPGLFLYYPRAARRIPKLAAFVACARECLGSAAK